MERSLTRCLRSRPTTSLLSNRQSNLTNQPLFARSTGLQLLRFNSSIPINNAENTRNTRNTTTTTTASHFVRPQRAPLQPNVSAEMNGIFDQLNLAAKNPKSVAAKAQNNKEKEPTLSHHERKSKIQLKLNPTLGREVTIASERGFDLDKAHKQLNVILKDNNVKYQQVAQKFHVRKGQMRKNLRIKRWRKLFAYSFAHTVGKIHRMRAQGW
ncbi:mitochondrial 37S ribosomal protein bS21m [Aspergillus mulundensis]|uniref:Uncharacterized protein n=1 Tax=Aspergillus mulundensis TaxID=1810919 RepID=A0A3D8SWC5_9EURO|nr:hypothetical protein DSM5745_02402 [Aspergillus mulundensis]RDW90627.1 hypothetical protein DSM5745_02402 [Aspergillus mulundensis]